MQLARLPQRGMCTLSLRHTPASTGPTGSHGDGRLGVRIILRPTRQHLPNMATPSYYRSGSSGSYCSAAHRLEVVVYMPISHRLGLEVVVYITISHRLGLEVVVRAGPMVLVLAQLLTGLGWRRWSPPCPSGARPAARPQTGRNLAQGRDSNGFIG